MLSPTFDPKVVQEAVQTREKRNASNDSGSPYTNMQPAPMHSTWIYSCVRDGVKPRPTQKYSVVCPEPRVTKSKWFLRRARRKAATQCKTNQKSTSCVTALLTGEGRQGVKRRSKKTRMRCRGLLHEKELHPCFPRAQEEDRRVPTENRTVSKSVKKSEPGSQLTQTGSRD